jgi:hypothetical protein
MSGVTDLSSAVWRTSSYTNGEGGNCVEVADGVPGAVPVRDTKRRRGPAISFPARGWTSFVEAVKDGSLERG